jgi:hypothetical protein
MRTRGAISGTPRRFVPYHLFVFARLEIEHFQPENQKHKSHHCGGFLYFQGRFFCGRWSIFASGACRIIKLVAAFRLRKAALHDALLR